MPSLGRSGIMEPPSALPEHSHKQQRTRFTNSDEEWEMRREEIRLLYIHYPLKKIMEIMRDTHGFHASERKYKAKIKEWGIGKNIPLSDMMVINAKATKRAHEDGKDTSFLVNGIPIQPQRLETFKRRKIVKESVPESPPAETPSNITYHTPESRNSEDPYQGLPSEAEYLDFSTQFSFETFKAPVTETRNQVLAEEHSDMPIIMASPMVAYADQGRCDLDIVGLRNMVFEGHEVLAESLLAQNEIDINLADTEGKTPLGRAVSEGHDAVVKILLTRDDIDINLADEDGMTPFGWAASEGHEAVVKLLLAWDDIDINLADEDGMTPLKYAASEGHEAVVKLLLARGDIDINLATGNGITSLIIAALKGYEGVVELLLARDDIDIDLADEDGMTPLACAASEGHEAVVKLLLARDDIDTNLADKDGTTPLDWAAYIGYKVVIKLLLARDDIDINLADEDGMTPLKCAASEGHEAVVRLLLARDDIDINLVDEDGMTPLGCAAHNRAVVDVRNVLGRTVLHLVAAYGHKEVVWGRGRHKG